MTINQLRYFDAICRCKNITRAAQELHVSQPTISDAMHELETNLGVQLFYHIKMRLVLTHEGELFWKEAAQILPQIDTLEQKMRDVGGKRNMIRIGISPMIGSMIFPQLLLAFREKYPDTKVEAKEFGSLTNREQVLNESLDLAIVISNGIDSNKFNCLPIMETATLFCISEHHPLAIKKKVTIDDFKDEPLIILTGGAFQTVREGSYNAVQIESMYEKYHYIPNVLLYSNQLYTVERLLQNSSAAAFLFREVADRMKGVVGIPVEQVFPPTNIGLIWKKDKPLYVDTVHFIDFIKHYKPDF